MKEHPEWITPRKRGEKMKTLKDLINEIDKKLGGQSMSKIRNILELNDGFDYGRVKLQIINLIEELKGSEVRK